MRVHIRKKLLNEILWDIEYNHCDDPKLDSKFRLKMELERKELIQKIKKCIKRGKK